MPGPQCIQGLTESTLYLWFMAYRESLGGAFTAFRPDNRQDTTRQYPVSPLVLAASMTPIAMLSCTVILWPQGFMRGVNKWLFGATCLAIGATATEGFCFPRFAPFGTAAGSAPLQASYVKASIACLAFML